MVGRSWVADPPRKAASAELSGLDNIYILREANVVNRVTFSALRIMPRYATQNGLRVDAQRLVAPPTTDLFKCEECKAPVFFVNARDHKRSHFRHAAGESCVIYDESFGNGHSALYEKEDPDGHAWLDWMTCDQVHSHAYAATVTGIGWSHSVSVLGRDDMIIEVRQGFVSPAEVALREQHYQGRRRAWIFKDPRKHVTLHMDTLYDGTTAMTVCAPCRRGVLCLVTDECYIDVGLHGKLLRVKPFADGEVYAGREGLCSIVDTASTILRLYGASLRFGVDELVDGLCKFQCKDGGDVVQTETDFVPWNVWQASGCARLGGGARPKDAAGIWDEIEKLRGVSLYAHRGTKIRKPNHSRRILMDERQKSIVEAIFRGENIDLAGVPGSGKSVVITAIANSFERVGRRVEVLAFTNSVASMLEGKTISSFVGHKRETITPAFVKQYIGDIRTAIIAEGVPDEDRSGAVKKLLKIVRAMRSCSLVIFDEKSMVRPEFFQLVMVLAETIFESSSPWGGIQVMFVGDVCQIQSLFILPDITFDNPGDKEKCERQFYESALTRDEWMHVLDNSTSSALSGEKRKSEGHSPFWRREFQRILQLEGSHEVNPYEMAKTVPYTLESAYRQEDAKLASILDGLRDGILTEESLDCLMSRCVSERPDVSFAVNLCFMKRTRDQIAKELTRGLVEKSFKITLAIEIGGGGIADAEAREFFKDELTAEAEREYGKIATELNADGEGFDFSFSLPVKGRVVVLEAQEDVPRGHSGILRIDQGAVYVGDLEIHKHSIVVTNPVGSYTITYMPLLASYASTIHSYQGLTAHRGVCLYMDLVRLPTGYVGKKPTWPPHPRWPESLGYTALSRAKRLRDVTLVVTPAMIDSLSGNRKPKLTAREIVRHAFDMSAKSLEFQRNFFLKIEARNAAFL